jgi:predicted deacetylase
MLSIRKIKLMRVMTSILKYKRTRYAFSAKLLVLLLFAYHIPEVGGEGGGPKFVLMRLEDIGPGGQYASLDQLGKLRAVLEYLRDEHVTYHLAVVPRWIDLPVNGGRYDVQLDQSEDPYVAAYQKVLHQAVRAGAVLGMHGYTHQVGNDRRDDDQHESGIGNEFNVTGVEETMSVSYAEKRLKEGLSILNNAGLKPQFWEAPHYRSTHLQDEVFRSYFGLNYQADVQTKSKSPVAQYVNRRINGYGASTLGNNIASFFYHPFMEFKYLVPVTDRNGEPMLRDGIPEYRYPDSSRSQLQKLVFSLRAKGYSFYSIQDYVPFTPAHSVPLPSGGSKLLVEDANGDGQKDFMFWDPKTGDISVREGHFQGLRNEPQAPITVWAHVDYINGAAAAVSGKSADGPCSFWTIHPSGHLDRYVLDGHHFSFVRSWKIDGGMWNSLYTLRLPGGDILLAGLTQDRMQLHGWLIHEGNLKALNPYQFRNEMLNSLQVRMEGGPSLIATKDGSVSGVLIQADLIANQWKVRKEETGLPNEDGLILFGDFNGDGREDALRWNSDTMHYTVYLKGEDGEWKLLSKFGPWGKPRTGSQLEIADFDGNGKSDLGLIQTQEGYMDLALSYESK